MRFDRISRRGAVAATLAALAFILFIGFGGRWLAAQEGVITSEVNQIYVPVSVATLEGDPVAGLKRSDFHLLENDIEQDILNMARDEVPLNVVFLMDVSHSEFMEVSAIKKAIRAFVKELGPEDKVAVVTFNTEARMILDWCNDQARLDKALDRVFPKGYTVWYDAMYVTVHDLLPAVKGKKVVVSVTDGWDTGSMVKFQDMVQAATSTDVQAYIISKTAGIKDYIDYMHRQNGGRAVDQTDLAKVMYACESQLQHLAAETGGRVITAGESGKLEDVYKKLVKELRQQYYLSYQPFNATKDGQYRKITVRVDKSNVRVFHRPGYYAK